MLMLAFALHVAILCFAMLCIEEPRLLMSRLAVLLYAARHLPLFLLCYALVCYAMICMHAAKYERKYLIAHAQSAALLPLERPPKTTPRPPQVPLA